MKDTRKIAVVFKALGDPTRLRILRLLSARGNPLCVGALARRLRISQPAVSQHLRVLRGIGVVRGNRLGVRVHYSIDGRKLLAYRAQIDAFLEHAATSDPTMTCQRGGGSAKRRCRSQPAS